MSPAEHQSSGRRSRRTASRDALKTSLSLSSFPRADSESATSSHNATPDLDYMEPAVERPPSPERLRQLSKQMKRASYLRRPRTQQNESSGTSPRRAMERSPWEQAFDGLTLSRHPSNRSNTSSDPPRERPERESVQLLGRNLFQRTNKASKRASSSYSSSNSSLHSGEMPPDGVSKDSLLPSLFARRKPSQDESAQKKLQISGPFNFQHVTHTQRENLPDLRRGNRMEIASEFSSIRSPGPATAPGALQIDAQDLHHFANKSIDSIEMGNFDASLKAPPSRPSLTTHHTAPTLSPPRRGMRSAKSQDYLRSSPPRSSPRPLSPATSGNEEPTSGGPVPPPRSSSRQSLMPDGFSAFASASLDRPRTSGGFRQPKPFDPSDALDQSPPPATSHGFVPPSDFEAFGVDEKRFSHALTTPDDVAWPLSGSSTSPSPYDKALPDVPEAEEEEHSSPQIGRSRLSITSNKSSLRGTQSVPLLRSFSQSQRPTSGASDTLGPFDTTAAQRLSQIDVEDASTTENDPEHDNWEDDIDYCYEHEAEANFNYQWERPSLDGHREPAATPALQRALEEEELAEANPAMVHVPMPAVTVPSQPSTHTRSHSRQHQPARYPLDFNAPNEHLAVTSNFSLPRGEQGSRVSQLKGIRPVSYASSFRESHGFNLSPTLLIPGGDFHQQMMAEQYEYHDDDIVGGPFHDEISTESDDRSPLSNEQRSSTSTTETNSTSQTDTTGERHVSANSTFTAMTRLTVSSSNTSLNKASGVIAEKDEPMPTTQFIDAKDDENEDEESTPPATRDTVPELAPFPVMNFAKKPYHRPHASESIVRQDIGQLKSADPARLRRPRARTSSLSAQIAPPVGQYALFPRSNIKGTGDRI